MSTLAILTKCPLAKCPLAKCPLAKCRLAKCPLAKCHGFSSAIQQEGFSKILRPKSPRGYLSGMANFPVYTVSMFPIIFDKEKYM